MKEAYVSLEVAKLLKEKGFEVITYMVYDNQGNFDYQNCVCCNVDRMPCLYAPTHQMAMAWLREKKYISIVIDDEIPLSYKYIIKKYNITELYKVEVLKLDSLPFAKYEDAVEAALKYCLENLI